MAASSQGLSCIELSTVELYLNEHTFYLLFRTDVFINQVFCPTYLIVINLQEKKNKTKNQQQL